jgi:electron transport complex protein RnfB
MSGTYPIFSIQTAPQTEEERLVRTIDAVLPQTQCTKCGYTGCKPYAEAIAKGEADINQCPPGGDKGIHVLAELLDRPYKPLNPANGIEAPRTLAFIDEALCIGCTLCIQACPVDAIVGAAKLMHTVVKDKCTGCDLCVAPCPVDCIYMLPIPAEQLPSESEQQGIADLWRQNHEFHLARLARERQEKTRKTAAMKAASTHTEAKPAAELMASDAKKALIAAAMERARQQREAIKPKNTDVSASEIDAIEARRKQSKPDQ